jgi:hypothetical protein
MPLVSGDRVFTHRYKDEGIGCRAGGMANANLPVSDLLRFHFTLVQAWRLLGDLVVIVVAVSLPLAAATILVSCLLAYLTA